MLCPALFVPTVQVLPTAPSALLGMPLPQLQPPPAQLVKSAPQGSLRPQGLHHAHNAQRGATLRRLAARRAPSALPGGSQASPAPPRTPTASSALQAHTLLQAAEAVRRAQQGRFRLLPVLSTSLPVRSAPLERSPTSALGPRRAFPVPSGSTRLQGAINAQQTFHSQ